jgi:hypothetical protein
MIKKMGIRSDRDSDSDRERLYLSTFNCSSVDMQDMGRNSTEK